MTQPRGQPHLTAAMLLAASLNHGVIAQSTNVKVDDPVPVTLQTMRDQYRPLLVFAPTDNDPRFLSQARNFATGSFELHQREVLFVPLNTRAEAKSWGVVLNAPEIGKMPAAGAVEARNRFHIAPDDFTVILLGKDGGEKLRSHTPVTMEELSNTIDSMPMRQQEIRQRTRSSTQSPRE